MVFGPNKGKGGDIGKSDDQLIQDLIAIHNAENWLGMDEDGLGPVQPPPPSANTSTSQPASNSNLAKSIGKGHRAGIAKFSLAITKPLFS